MKRAFDFCCAATGLALLSPLLVTLGAMVWLEDRASPLFFQARVGQFGRRFWIWKFRTMVVNADQLGPSITIGKDPRITRVGHWLRKTKLDELPQLWNVLTGEMSLVGPRPEVAKYVELYTEEQRAVLRLRPGITDPASIEYYEESERLAASEDAQATYISEIMPAKLAINLRYAHRAGLMKDAEVIIRTLLRMAGIRQTTAVASSEGKAGDAQVRRAA